MTNNLTNVTNSNTQTEVTEGFYSATLTVDDGYSLNSVVITMGGEDITDSVYTAETGSILVTEVTGDIVITAVAIELEEIKMGAFISQTMNAYTDDGTTILATKYYMNGATSYNATESDASVKVIVTNNAESAISTVLYIGSGEVGSMKYAVSKSVSLDAGASTTYEYIVRGGKKLTVVDQNNVRIAITAFGVLDVYQPTAEYPVATKQVATIKVYSDGTTDTQLHSAYYHYVAYTAETFAEDTDLIVTLVGGEADATISGTDWYLGSVDQTALATVYHGVRAGGANTTVRAGQVIKKTYTVKAGYSLAIAFVTTALTADMVYVEKA